MDANPQMDANPPMDSNPNTDSNLSKFERFRSSKGFITFTVSYAVFTDCFLYAAIVPMAPFALKKAGFEDDAIQENITLMLAVFGAVCFAASGWVPFLIGLIVLLVATAVLWSAPFVPHKTVLAVSLVGRATQGFASAVVWTTAMAVLVDTVGQERLGGNLTHTPMKAAQHLHFIEHAGWIGLALNFGNILGPVLGGVVYEYGGVHGLFGLCIWVIALDIILRLIMKERARQPLKGKVSDSSLESGAGPTNKEATVELRSLPTFSTSATETSLMARRSVPNPTRIPAVLRLLGSTRFCVNLWGVFVLAIIFTALDAVLPVTVERILGWNATLAGVIFLPFSLPSLVGMQFGKLTDRFGGRWFIFASLTAACPALIALRFVQENAPTDVALLIFLLFFIGLCTTIILEPLFAEFARRATELQESDKHLGRDIRYGYYAQAYAHFNMAWSLGNTVGPLMAGYINNAAGWNGATLATGVICGFSAIPLVLYSEGPLIRKWSLRRQARQPE
ncbi:hypothetical protein PRZ48_011019 [Zasmidium cellare]|uniref:Major facilitator superfamily (MFS) profile domain-containing protein n=1 Tax=Zasmidium cellare TaxID=395010 RepID=A0ABR0EAA7_ZASCE|nr:hypothetical protein PRZ48_011019 [Zasmidium cellare]